MPHNKNKYRNKTKSRSNAAPPRKPVQVKFNFTQKEQQPQRNKRVFDDLSLSSVDTSPTHTSNRRRVDESSSTSHDTPPTPNPGGADGGALSDMDTDTNPANMSKLAQVPEESETKSLDTNRTLTFQWA